MTESELVIKAKSGDADAFCELYSAYKQKLYNYAYFRLGDRDDAEDAVQCCVLSAFEQIKNLKKAESFKSWIFRILYCSCTKFISDRIHQRQTLDIDDYADIISPEGDAIVLRQELQSALEQLSKEEQDIVLLSAVAGFKSGRSQKLRG